MRAACRALVVLAVATASAYGRCQSFYYVEPGNVACPAAPAETPAAPTTVERGASVSGSISVSCGLDKGSYTVTLDSTDPAATFAPKSFLVNFGAVVGDGVFTVTFHTVGVQTVSAAIASNMGSAAVRGYFTSRTSEFNVVRR